MAEPLTPEQAQLLEAIETLLGDNANAIQLPLTAINQSIAQLSVQNSRAIASIQSKLLKSIDQFMVDNSNAVDALGMAILAPLQGWQDENYILLTQLAAGAGLTGPGDPLEAALIKEVAEEPQVALSASLLIALRDALPYLAQLIEVLREIRDRMPSLPAHVPGEPEAEAPSAQLPGVQVEFDWNSGVRGPM
jgi:hypothetical protein